VFYRVNLQETGTVFRYSPIIRLSLQKQTGDDVLILPNPVRDVMQIYVNAAKTGDMKFQLFNTEGKLVLFKNIPVNKGNNAITIDELSNYSRGIYYVMLQLGDEIIPKKIMLSH
jgi:hypothetical protein